MEGLNVSDANLLVRLHPSMSKNVHRAILHELSTLLLRFNETFDGVVLAYEFNISDKDTKILPGIHPYFSVRLKTKLLVFSPKPDMLLEGKVVKIRQESIHVIVLGFSSAFITDKDIREELQYKTKHGKELFISRSHKRHVIKVGTMIRLLVKSVDEETLCISGSLLPSHTGNILWLDKQMEAVSPTDRSNKRTRGNVGESFVQEPSRTSAEEFSDISDHYSKKSKKHGESVMQEPSRISAEAFSVISDHSIKKSKKNRESVLQEPSRTSAEAFSGTSDRSIKKSKKHKTRDES